LKTATERLVWLPLFEAEAEELLKFQKKNYDFFGASSPTRPEGYLTELYWEEQIKMSFSEFEDDRAYRFVFCERGNDQKIIGFVNFSQVFRGPFQACYLGYGIDRDLESRGYTTEAVKESIRYVFDNKNLHRIMANYMPTNLGSAKVLKKLGFIVEGEAKNYLRINGRWEDHILTSLTNRDWKPKLSK